MCKRLTIRSRTQKTLERGINTKRSVPARKRKAPELTEEQQQKKAEMQEKKATKELAREEKRLANEQRMNEMQALNKQETELELETS